VTLAAGPSRLEVVSPAPVVRVVEHDPVPFLAQPAPTYGEAAV
jgi:hypothetical protein